MPKLHRLVALLLIPGLALGGGRWPAISSALSRSGDIFNEQALAERLPGQIGPLAPTEIKAGEFQDARALENLESAALPSENIGQFLAHALELNGPISREFFSYKLQRFVVERYQSADSKIDRLIRVGDLFYIGAEDYGKLPQALIDKLGGRIIILAGDGLAQMTYFTLSAVVGLMAVGVTGKRVVDVGAGTGILALTAARSGASSLALIEHGEAECDQANVNIRLNRLEEKSIVLKKELSELPAILAALETSENQETVIVANIGPWFDVTNADVIRLAAQVPGVTALILAGYMMDYGEGDKAVLPPELHKWYRTIVEDDMKVAREHRFEVDPEWIQSADVPFGPVAWLAFRPAALRLASHERIPLREAVNRRIRECPHLAHDLFERAVGDIRKFRNYLVVMEGDIILDVTGNWEEILVNPVRLRIFPVLSRAHRQSA